MLLWYICFGKMYVVSIKTYRLLLLHKIVHLLFDNNVLEALIFSHSILKSCFKFLSQQYSLYHLHIAWFFTYN